MSIRLKLLRKKLGVTLETLAEKSGMTKSYLSKVERGLNTPSIADLPIVMLGGWCRLFHHSTE